MSIQESHEWAKEKAKNWGTLFDAAKTIVDRKKEYLTPPSDLLEFENPSFRGDVCSRDGDLLFHFFPTENDRFNVIVTTTVDGRQERAWSFTEQFPDILGDAFLEVFKFRERLFWDYVPELHSFVVRCAGQGDNPLRNDMIEQVLVAIKRKNNDD